MKNFFINRKVLYIFLFLSFFSFYLSFFQRPVSEPIEEMTYVTFMEKAEEGLVEKVTINPKATTFTASIKEDKTYKVENPKSEGFKETLLLKEIDVEEISPTDISEYISGGLSLILILILLSALRGMGRAGKPNEISVENGNVPQVKFEDIIANKDFLDEIKQFVEFLKEPDIFAEMGAKMPKGLIFYGPPGTGKTLTARAIAGEAGVPFYSVSGSDFIEMYVGVGAMRVRKLFKEARKKKNCIIFIDELDAVGGRRTSDANSESRQTINALLAEMDGFSLSDGILVIGATNKFEDLDPALVRAGRFDRHIAVPLPETKEERKDLLKLYSRKIPLSDDVDMDTLSRETIGFSPAAIASLVNDAVLVALGEKMKIVNQKHFEKAMFRRLTSGHERSNEGKMSDTDIRTIAYHESGHAIMAKLLTTQTVSKVTIMGSTSGVGGATFILPEKLSFYSEKELKDQIKILYGGRAAEEVLQDHSEKITNGASNDMQRVSMLVKKMYMEYGMIGNILNLEQLQSLEKEDIEKIEAFARACYEETVTLLRENRHILDEVAKRLMEKETIYEPELDSIIKEGGE